MSHHVSAVTMGGHYFTQRNGTCGTHGVAPLIVLQAEQKGPCEVALELQRGNETKDNHVHLETKNNYMHLRVRALRDDSRVEHLFPSVEYQHHSEAAANPPQSSIYTLPPVKLKAGEVYVYSDGNDDKKGVCRQLFTFVVGTFVRITEQ